MDLNLQLWKEWSYIVNKISNIYIERFFCAISQYMSFIVCPYVSNYSCILFLHMQIYIFKHFMTRIKPFVVVGLLHELNKPLTISHYNITIITLLNFIWSAIFNNKHNSRKHKASLTT